MTRTTVVERPRTGFVAWVQRNVSFLEDPDPVEVDETERVNGMTVKEIETIAVYQLSHRVTF